jgi:cytochrome c-type biogenesis protein CcmE
MTRKQRRATFLGLAVAILGLAVGLVVFGLRDKITFFHAPSDVFAKNIKPGLRFRLGGLVEACSVQRGQGATIKFVVTDTAKTVPVAYTGVLPDLFREGQGVVTEGKLDATGTFVADTIMAKHDEVYMPPEVAKALKDKGVWQGAGAAMKPADNKAGCK